MNSSTNIICGVSQRYGDTNALTDITIEIKPREFVSIIGQNASGKSTLLKIIAGIIPATSGSISLQGETGYMPQDHALLPWRTVEENLYLPSDIRNIPRESMRKKVGDLLAEFALEQYASTYPASLSGGTRQKIALLRTALQDHPLLLLDEPFAPIDAITRLEMQSWLQALVKKAETSVLFVTHDIREAIFLSDTIYVLESGTIKEKIAVPLPRPRKHEHLQTPDALELEKKLFSLLAPNI
jgi:ABC-type nitrate/sulfonate/bicarbonate transport system ATPase subunit